MDREKYQREFYAKSWIYSKHRTNQYNYDIAKLLLRFVKPGDSVCDIGIGDGTPIAEAMLDSGMNVYGIDISEELINICKNNFGSINCKVGTADTLPYDDDMFQIQFNL